MDLRTLSIGQEQYPDNLLRRMNKKAPQVLWFLGNEALFHRRKLGVVCSVKCPGSIILRTSSLVKNLPGENLAVVSGFHSPLEKECLRIVGRRKLSAIVVVGRSLIGARIPVEWQSSVEHREMLLVSAFKKGSKRLTSPLANKRNELVAAMADTVWIPHAAPASKTELLAWRLLKNGMRVFTLSDDANANLLDNGATPLSDIQELVS